MSRLKKVIGLPQRYWDKIEERIDKELIRSYGDAIMSILNDTYPKLKTTPTHVNDTFSNFIPLPTPHQSRTNVEQPKQPNTPKEPHQLDKPICQCGHPESYHTEDGCLGDGGLCKCNQFKEVLPTNQTA
jgi:hypothetical protein